MGIYNALILPRLLDMAMRNSRLAAYRNVTIGAARGLKLLSRRSHQRHRDVRGGDAHPRATQEFSKSVSAWG